MRIVSMADLHITCLKKLLKNESYNRTEKALTELLFLIWYINPDVILISGDIFDSPYPSKDEIHLFMNFLLPILKAEINVLVIPGNHDSDREGGKTAISFLEPFDKAIENFYITINDFRCVIINDIAFYMWPWGRLPHEKDLAKVSHIECAMRIGMSHITLSGTRISKDNLRLKQGYSIASLTEAIRIFGLNYMFLGDIHEYQKVLDNAIYSGAIYQTKFNESPNKGIVCLDTTKNSISFHEVLNVPKLLTIRDAELEDIEEENFYSLNVDSKESLLSFSNIDLPRNIVRIMHPFGKEVTNKKIIDSNRKVGFNISVPLVMIKVLKKQGVKDITGVVTHLMDLVDSRKDLILP